MTFFSEVNKDAMSGDVADIASGPRVNFLEGFKNSWEGQVRASSQFGIEVALADEDDAQFKALKAAGVENIPRLAKETLMVDGEQVRTGVDGYLDTAKYFEDGGDEAQAARFRTFDDRVEALRKDYPGMNLKTSREMWEQTRDKARAAEDRVNNSRKTFTGHIGDFVGGTLASMNPETDPLNFLTLGVGGFGKSAAMRIATEAGAQGVIETLNQVTGVQEERRLLGLEHGLGDAVSRVAGTAIAGGAIQGVGEGLMAAGKRFFRNTPVDPAPPEPKLLALEYKPKKPEEIQTEIEADNLMRGGSYTDQLKPISTLRGSRMADQRTVLDMDYVESRLQAWDGEEPHMIPPRTDTAIPKPFSPFVAQKIELDGPGDRLDALAREIDPDMFRVYDKLAAEKQTYRRWIDELRPTEKKALDQLSDMSDEIDKLKDLMARSGARANKKQQTKLDKLVQERDAAVEKIRKTDTPEMSAVRERILQNDFKMRDLAPLVGRAYAHAQKQWDLGEADRELVRQMVRDGRPDLPKTDRPVLADTYENTAALFSRTMTERVPILEQAPSVAATMREGSDAADFVSAIVKKQAEVMDKNLELYRSQLESVISDKGDGTIEINGAEYTYKFDLDKDTIDVPVEDGQGSRTISIRELLEDNADAEADMKAVTTCSIK